DRRCRSSCGMGWIRSADLYHANALEHGQWKQSDFRRWAADDRSALAQYEPRPVASDLRDGKQRFRAGGLRYRYDLRSIDHAAARLLEWRADSHPAGPGMGGADGNDRRFASGAGDFYVPQ